MNALEIAGIVVGSIAGLTLFVYGVWILCVYVFVKMFFSWWS